MDYLKEIAQYNTRKAGPSIHEAALLVIDMQKFFTAIGKPIMGNVRSLIDTARSVGVPVIFTRHGHHDLNIDGGMLAEWWGNDLSIYGSGQWQLMEGIKPAGNETIVDKTRYSAFFGTGLETMLRERGIRDIVIAGVMTNCCCETTARDAFMRNFRVFIAADATATVNDDLHISSLKNLAFACAYVMSAEELCSSFGGRR